MSDALTTAAATSPAAPSTPVATTAGAETGLFRLEALTAQRSQWMGTVLLAPKASHSVFSTVAVLAVIGLLVLAVFGEFTRKARVSGWLVPEKGLVRVITPQPGVISEVKVQEGATVQRGDPLVVLSTERQSARLGATEAGVARSLSSRRISLESEIEQQGQQLAQQKASVERRLKAMREEIAQFNSEIAVQESRMALAKSSAERVRDLHAKGFASQAQLQQTEEAELDQRARHRALLRTRAERQREMVTLQSELQDLPLRAQTQIEALRRAVAELEGDLAVSEARRRFIIEAPQSGTVASLQADVGSTADNFTPLLSIVPEGGKLQAHLYVPSRSIGFIQPGQPVLLRYQAYPYQKFGHAEGTVKTISKSAIGPAELPQSLAGLTSLTGPAEPVYRVVVTLDRQSITAYGKEQALQPGMQLDSDILLERRKLYEWVLEPLFTLSGKL